MLLASSVFRSLTIWLAAIEKRRRCVKSVFRQSRNRISMLPLGIDPLDGPATGCSSAEKLEVAGLAPSKARMFAIASMMIFFYFAMKRSDKQITQISGPNVQISWNGLF